MNSRNSSWIQVVSHLDPVYGGLSAAVPALGQRIAEAADINVSLAAFCSPEENFEPAGYDPTCLTRWPASRRPWLADRWTANHLLPAFQKQFTHADGIHIHGLWEQSTAVASRIARAAGIPYVLSAHGMLEPWALASKRLKKLVYSFLIERANVQAASCLHALTHAEAAQYVNFGARSPIAVIPNGVDLPTHRDPADILEQFPELKGKRVILFLGRLHPKKGLELLLESWSTLAERFPQAHLLLAGPDSEGTQSRLQQIVSENGLHDSVTFAGMLRDSMKWSALAAAEAFVLPSASEGLSVAVLEAMGMGLPVVITRACNMPSVAESRAGWIIDPNSAQLASALLELLSMSPSEAAQIGARGAALIDTHYTWPHVARQMAEVYQWVAGGPRPASVELVFPEAS